MQGKSHRRGGNGRSRGRGRGRGGQKTEKEIFGDLEDLNFKHKIPNPSIFDMG